ncbi:hypothetical protein B0H10DRAFT_1213561 [Mycena sp. CBHHK59/15]|nr:hypothetical protein B0H10DRAFT_1213561 [Mycena sp. CBHHK59/15]
MTLHDPSQPHDEQPTARVHSFKVDIRLRFSLNIRLPRMGRRKLPVLPPSFRKDFSESGNVVKEGPVCATESDVFLRGCQWLSTGKANWFVLTETSLTLCASKRAAPQATILLHDIAKLERADGNPRRLILETKDGKCYLLTFRNNNDLHGVLTRQCRVWCEQSVELHAPRACCNRPHDPEVHWPP